MNLSIELAEKLEQELYGTFRQMPDGRQVPVLKGILQKSIPVFAKIQLEQKIGKQLREVLTPYREEVKTITNGVKQKYLEDIKQFEKVKIEVDDMALDENLKSEYRKAKYDLAIREYDLNDKINSEINTLLKDIDRSQDMKVTIDKDWKMKYNDFDKKINKDGDFEIVNTFEGEDHYPIFTTNFLTIE